MDVISIIDWQDALPVESLPKEGEDYLRVSEFFFGTIQGEGVNLGTPAAFLRLAGCPVNCKWCDTNEVWHSVHKVSIDWLVGQCVSYRLAEALDQGYHLVITGGSPLMQQRSLANFIRKLRTQCRPYIEVENECFYKPDIEFRQFVDCWNNSPKLANSNVVRSIRYKPEIIEEMSALDNSWFKFVVKDETDIKEILDNYLKKKLIRKEQVILMPMGATRKEYESNREKVVELAVKHGFRYSPREHIAIWDKKTGI